MNTNTDDGINCGGCGASMSLEAGHASADLDGRFRCDECRAEDAEDAAAEREYDAERAEHAMRCDCSRGGARTSAGCAAFAVAAPAPADPGKTVRIPTETMASLVFGGAR
jgi:hypothetical protein